VNDLTDMADAKILQALQAVHDAFAKAIKGDPRLVDQSAKKVGHIKSGTSTIRDYCEFLAWLVGRQEDVISNAAADCGKLAERLNTCSYIALSFPRDAMRRADAVRAEAKTVCARKSFVGPLVGAHAKGADEEDFYAVFGCHLSLSALADQRLRSPDDHVVAARKPFPRHRFASIIACNAHLGDLRLAHAPLESLSA
jgi:hypothetical protein